MTAPPRRKINMHLSLPPRMTLSRTDSGDSAPITPGPHTPLPYEFGYFHSGMEAKHLATDLLQLDGSSLLNGVGSKRNREDDDDDDEKVEPEWTEEETDVIQSTLIHPFRPISTHYPPGELPPPNVIDELTNQIIKYAFRRHHSERQFSPTSDCSDEGWTHSWDATRKKLFDTALVESKFGHDAEERKMTREERQHRPGLRRMDSMDFLDQVESEQSNESIGRALRLSTTLQNTAKQEPLLLGLSRSTSGLSSEPLCSPGSSAASITLTPASPTAPAPPLRRKGSFRATSTASRPSSLLQRGRSFTAEDLRAEAEAEEKSSTEVTSEASPSAPSPSRGLMTSPITMTPLKPQLLPPTAHVTARLTRSQSSSSTLHPPAHAAQKMFLSSPKPSTTDRATLAMPLSPPKPIESPLKLPLPIVPKSARSTNLSSWSDSEDEGLIKTRAVKKMKQGKAQSLRGPALVQADQLINSGGLRSPFEEKEEPSF